MTNENQREYAQLKVVADTGRYKILVKDDEPFIPGVRGQVEPYSLDGQTLAAFTSKATVLKQLLALSFVTPHQVGQSEGSVLFSVEHFATMADFLKLRKKRPRPTEAQITLGRAALKDFHIRQRAKKVGKNQQKEKTGVLTTLNDFYFIFSPPNSLDPFQWAITNRCEYHPSLPYEINEFNEKSSFFD